MAYLVANLRNAAWGDNVADSLTRWQREREEAADAIVNLVEALKEGRRAIGDHSAPSDCYATGPVTGNLYRDLVECPACSFIALHDVAIAKLEQGA